MAGEGGPGLAEALPDLPNFRDVGGWPTADGRRVRRGLVYRAPALARGGPDTPARLAGLGLRTVVDLRSPWEREREPEGDLLPVGCTTVVADASGDDVVLSPMYQLRVLPTPAERQQAFGGGRAEAAFEAKFRAFASGQREREAFGRLLGALAEPGALPGVFHCSTGKDRTGWAGAVLLGLVGVGEEQIMADFVAGNDAIRELMRPVIDRHVADGGAEADIDALIGVRPAYLQAGLAELKRTWGTFSDYAEAGLGVERAAAERLRHALLEPA